MGEQIFLLSSCSFCEKISSGKSDVIADTGECPVVLRRAEAPKDGARAVKLWRCGRAVAGRTAAAGIAGECFTATVVTSVDN